MGKGYWSNIYPAIGSICSVLLLYFFVDMKFNLTHKYENALFSIIVPNLLIVCFVAHRLPGKYELRISKIYSDIRPLFKSSLGFFIFSLLVALITNLDYIIMSRILEEGAIAEYSILSKIFTFAYSFFYAALMTYWPIFSEKIYSKNFNYVNLIIKKILIYFFVFAVIGTIVFLNFKDIISDILTNGNIQLSIAPILAFSLYYLVRGFCDVYAVTIACTNKTKIFLLYMPIQVIVSIVLQLLLGRQYGIVGITLGLAISFLATAAWINFAEYRKMARGYLNKFNEEN